MWLAEFLRPFRRRAPPAPEQPPPPPRGELRVFLRSGRTIDIDSPDPVEFSGLRDAVASAARDGGLCVIVFPGTDLLFAADEIEAIQIRKPEGWQVSQWAGRDVFGRAV